MKEDAVRTYYQWVDIWKSQDEKVLYEFEVVLYKLKIPSRVKPIEEGYTLVVPYIYAELAASIRPSYEARLLDFPDQLPVRDKWESYNRFKPVKSRWGGSRAVLAGGLILLALLTFQWLYTLLRSLWM